MQEDEKTVTLTREHFREISTSAAAKICHLLDNPKMAMFSVILIAETEKMLFDEQLEVEEKGE